MTAETTLDAAARYVNLGWTVTPIPYGRKGPTNEGWSTPEGWVDSVQRVVSSFGTGPMNIGLVHDPSRTVSIDIDDMEASRAVLAEFGIDLDALLSYGMRIVSPRANRAKVIFQNYEADFAYEKLTWPAREEGGKPVTIFELRAGIKQDVLPPSAHPDGGFYEWAQGQDPWTMKANLDGYLPQMPREMREFWRQWTADPSLKARAKSMCPWVEEDEPAPPPGSYMVRERKVSGEHQDIIGQFNQHFTVSQVLQEMGYKKRGKRWLAPESSTGVAGVNVFKDPAGHERAFSHHASDPLNNGYAHDAFDVVLIRQFGEHNIEAALDYAASRLGIMDRHERPLEVDPNVKAAIYAMIERAQHASQTREAAPGAPILPPVAPVPQPIQENRPEDAWPEEALQCGGLVEVASQWMVRTAQRPQPVLALAASLSLFSTGLANMVETQTKLRTNNYFIGVARTGEGKEHGRRCVKQAMQAAGLDDMLAGEDLASGSALMRRASEVPESLFQIDEFGLFLAALTNPKSDLHKREIGNGLLKLFSATGQMVRGTEYAGRERERLDIEYPCVNLHGTTTPETLWPAMSGIDISSGQLGRWLLMISPERPVPRNKLAPFEEPPQAVVEWLEAARKLGLFEDWMPASFNPNQPGRTAMPVAGQKEKVVRIPNDPLAHQLWDQFIDECDARRADAESNVVKDLWARAGEHAAKVAVVVALGKYTGPDLQLRSLLPPGAEGALQVDAGSMAWAIGFVKHIVTRTIREVGARVNDSEFGSWRQEIVRVLRDKMGPKGATKADLSANSRTWRYVLSPQVRKQVMQALMDDEEIFLMRFKLLAGRMREAWVHKDHMQQHLQQYNGSLPVGNAGAMFQEGQSS